MPKIPDMNLSPQSTPWGRWAQETIIEQVIQIAVLQEDLANLNKAVTALLKSS